MLQQLKQKQSIIIGGIIVSIILLGAGFFFATKKSEPHYRSKIEQIMFDKKNRSPMIVLTMPERNFEKKVEIMPSETVSEEEKTEEKPFDIMDIIKKIPSLKNLGVAESQIPSIKIDRNEDLILSENGMSIPAISKKGLKPWEDYANPVQVNPNFYRVAVIVENLGLNENETDLISQGLPSNVSFSFSPYTPKAESQIKKARMSGHETYIDLLLASKDFLKSDTGPMAMSIVVSEEENISRLKKSIALNAALGGFVINRGQAGKDLFEPLEKLLTTIKNMGLATIDASNENILDNSKIEKIPHTIVDIYLDETFTPEAIETKLQEAEFLAKKNGQVLIVITPKPSTVVAINDWIKTFSPQLTYEEMIQQNITKFERPFALVPVSALITE